MLFSSEANVLPFKEFCKKQKRWKSDGARSGPHTVDVVTHPNHVAKIFAE